MLDTGRAVGTTTDNHRVYRGLIFIFFEVNHDGLRQPVVGVAATTKPTTQQMTLVTKRRKQATSLMSTVQRRTVLES